MEQPRAWPTFANAAGSPDTVAAFDRRLRHVNRAMAALTHITGALIRATDRQHLLDDACHIAVEVGGYRLAWVGWKRHDADKTIEPVASSGIGLDFVGEAKVTWADSERGHGPAGTAIRNGTPEVARDIATDPGFAPWRDAALRHGFGSVAALPLFLQDEVVGAFVIYAPEPDAFDQDELQLLEDLARNLSYGITALRAEQQRRHAESELKESEERYRALVELSPDAVLAHRAGRIVFANAAANRIFRAGDDKALLGRALTDLIHPDDRAVAGDGKDASCPETLIEERMLRLDGEPFSAEVTSADIAYHGQDTRLLVVRDVTDRRQAQDQLVQTAKLATLGEMAAGMAHELSQPLNVIRMASEGALMLIGRGRASDEYKEKQFQLIAAQTSRMAEIIDHIRIFSRKDTGAVEVFDASSAVRQAIELFERQLAGENVALTVSYAQRPCPVVGRPVQLEQVILNLLTNARDSVRDKRLQPGFEDFAGRLEVVTTSSDELGLIWLSISDNGTGLPPEAVQRLFEPFFTTKEVGRGTGLGLSVSFGIVAAMSGRIDACNNKEGASFVVTLPLSKSPVAASPPPKHDEPRSASGPAWCGQEHHLLVVDDEEEAAQAMASYLREHGYRVTTASNGSEAWQRFQDDPAAVVITDLRMPRGDGRELISRLREFDPLLPIIVVTGHMGVTERLSDNEIDDELAVVVKKPVSLQMLAETIELFIRA